MGGEALDRASPPSALVGGKYRCVEAVVSRGDVAIWRAVDPAGAEVLLKIVPRANSERENARREHYVTREIACGEHLRGCEAIRALLESGTEDDGSSLGFSRGYWFLVLEWIEGGSLRDLLESRGSLRPAEVRDVVKRVGAALTFAHSLPSPIIHRDVKPENILIPAGRLEQAKLCDFGTARISGTGTFRTVTPKGTDAYMAPEQTEASAPLTPAVDQYALALVAWELLVNERPFDEGDPFTNMNHRGKQAYRPLIEREGEPCTQVERVLRRALELEARRRFRTTRTFVSEFCGAGVIDGLWDGKPLRLTEQKQRDAALQRATKGLKLRDDGGLTLELATYLREKGFEVRDQRPKGGALWVVANHDAKDKLKSLLGPFGISVRFRGGEVRSTGGRPAWWTKAADPAGPPDPSKAASSRRTLAKRASKSTPGEPKRRRVRTSTRAATDQRIARRRKVRARQKS